MTKKSGSSRKSSTRRKRSTTSRRQSTRWNLLVTSALLLTVVIVGAYYLRTGSDPLGLFTQVTATPAGDNTPLATVGRGGDWWQVYFTDPANANAGDNLRGTPAEKLIERISSAQSTIHIAAFEFNLTPVAEALIAAHQRGVEVLWVTDDENGLGADQEEGHGQFAMLKKAGIEVRDDGRSALMHNKFWIFDRKAVWTGSTNITVNGMLHNNNNVIVIESPELADIYEREFAEMWAGKFGPTSPSTLNAQTLTIDGTPIQVLFAPEDEVASHLVPLIEQAQKSIRFMAFSFTHQELGDTVLARARAGLDVRGIFETRGSETEYSQLPVLYCAHVPVRQDGNPATFHHKVFVIDDKIVITGSFNFTGNADQSNDENAIIVTNSQIAAQYLQEFERRWAEAKEPDPADMGCE
jgi:phosphatidylserine/phosphatidylglycerophosphate/cardiolipin synthase-like enzyme